MANHPNRRKQFKAAHAEAAGVSQSMLAIMNTAHNEAMAEWRERNPNAARETEAAVSGRYAGTIQECVADGMNAECLRRACGI